MKTSAMAGTFYKKFFFIYKKLLNCTQNIRMQQQSTVKKKKYN